MAQNNLVLSWVRHRHSPSKFPFWQVVNASISFLLPKAYTYLTSMLESCQSLHTFLKIWDVKTDKEAKSFQQETSSGASVTGNKTLGEVLPQLFSNNCRHMKKTQSELSANCSPSTRLFQTVTSRGNCSTPFSERNVCKQPFKCLCKLIHSVIILLLLMSLSIFSQNPQGLGNSRLCTVLGKTTITADEKWNLLKQCRRTEIGLKWLSDWKFLPHFLGPISSFSKLIAS